MVRMKVVVDFDLCESNAICMGIAPEVFEVREDDFLYILDENPPESLRPQWNRPWRPALGPRSPCRKTDLGGRPRLLVRGRPLQDRAARSQQEESPR